jgi:phosphoglycolate phosphatase-like HAD superfamily hydrolase
MPAKAAVILDVDGTLIDSNDAHARAWVDAFAEHGIAVAFDHVRRSIGMGGDKLMPAVSGIEESGDLGGRIAARRGEIFKSRYLPQLRPFPRARDLIERFGRDGFTLVVASSAKDDELGPLLERAGVADLLPKRTSSDDAEESKPDPDIIVAALRQSRCEPSRTIMLGDTAYDIAAAKRAGIQIVALECGGWTREALAGAAAVFRDPADLLAHYDESPFATLSTHSSPSLDTR